MGGIQHALDIALEPPRPVPPHAGVPAAFARAVEQERHPFVIGARCRLDRIGQHGRSHRPLHPAPLEFTLAACELLQDTADVRSDKIGRTPIAVEHFHLPDVSSLRGQVNARRAYPGCVPEHVDQGCRRRRVWGSTWTGRANAGRCGRARDGRGRRRRSTGSPIACAVHGAAFGPRQGTSSSGFDVEQDGRQASPNGSAPAARGFGHRSDTGTRWHPVRVEGSSGKGTGCAWSAGG
jgi:hypothetical protein